MHISTHLYLEKSYLAFASSRSNLKPLVSKDTALSRQIFKKVHNFIDDFVMYPQTYGMHTNPPLHPGFARSVASIIAGSV